MSIRSCCLSGLLIAVVATHGAQPLNAQSTTRGTATSRPTSGEFRGGGGGPLDRIRQVINSLDLTPAQDDKIRQLMQETRGKFLALRQSGANRDDLRAKGGPILMNLFTQMKTVLTPDQLDKLRSTMQDLQLANPEPSPRETVEAAPTTAPMSDAGPAVGEIAPSFSLKTAEGGAASSSQLRGKNLLLVFGCASSPTFRDHAAALEKFSRDNVGKLNTVVIYTREIHAAGNWEVDRNKDQNLSIDQPANSAARATQALQMKQSLKLSMPVAVDSMDDAVAKAYGNVENTAYLINKDGAVLVHQKWFEPYALRRSLDTLDTHAMKD